MDVSFSIEKDFGKEIEDMLDYYYALSISHINSSNLVPFGRRHKLWDTFYGPQQDIWQSLFVTIRNIKTSFSCVVFFLVYTSLDQKLN